MSWFQSANRFSDPTGAKRIALYVDLLSRFPAGHLVDLGAGHGIFSRIAVDLGWRVTAVDARDVRFPDDPNVTWVVSDVREFDRYDDVDLIVCLGLWYHLTAEDQRALARRMYPRPLIMDTHIATRAVPRRFKALVTPGFVRDGVDDGRWYDETGFESIPTASWGNERSFWPTVRSLERQFYDAGYEIFEHIGPPYLRDRGFFVARNLTLPTGRAGLDSLIRTRGPQGRWPEAPADTAQPHSLFPAVRDWAPPGRRPAPSPQVVPVRRAARQLVRSVARVARRRARQVRAASSRRRSR